MKIQLYLLAVLLLLSTLDCQLSTLFAQSTVFTYQGRVLDNGTNFNGNGLFKFALVTSTNTSRQATATANVNGGFVTSYNVTDGGNGYTVAPAVTVSGGGGSGATATATVNGGVVTGITANNPGSGYTSALTVAIAAPPNTLSYTTYWSNDGTSVAGSEPTAAVSLSVANGLFTVVLGDTILPNMTAINSSLFTQPNLQLRIWFNDGLNGFAALSPAQNLTPSPYAVFAKNASNLLGTLASSQLSGTVSLAQLPGGLITNNQSGVNLLGSFTGNGVGLTNVPGAIPTQTAAGTTVLALANAAYDATNMAPVTLTLPTNANVGDVVKVNGLGAGGWQVAAAAGQVVNGSQLGATWLARDSNRNWQSVASSADGSRLVAVVPGATGQIFVSTDSGTNWIARDAPRNWQAVASSADGSKLVAVVGGSGSSGQIYTSTDGGTNWTARESSRQWSSVASSADGSKLVAAEPLGSGTGGQIYTSTDGGTNWTAQSVFGQWSSIASSANGNKLLAAGTGGGPAGQIYISTDGGTNWTARESGRQWSSVASSADGNNLVAADQGSVLGGQIYTSTDGGTNWTARGSSQKWWSVASSADGTKLVAVVGGGPGSAGQIYTSSDGGTNWTPRESNRQWSAVASSADGSKLVAGVFGGQIYTSVPTLAGTQGSTVELQYAGNGVWQVLGVNVALRAGGNDFIGLQSVSGSDKSQLKLQNSSDGRFWYLYDDSSGNLIFQPNTGAGGYVRRSDGNYVVSSDARLKRDIAPLGFVLDRVLCLRPVSYHFRSAAAEAPLTLGLIAQEVEPLFPEVVGEHAGMKGLAYSGLVPVTIRAIQELNQKVDSENERLRGELRRGDATNAKLSQELRDLKQLVNKIAAERNGGAR